MESTARKLMDAVYTGLIDASCLSEEALRPKLLYNDVHQGNTVLSGIEQELQHCDRFWFSVAFVTRSGLIVLKNLFRELAEKQPSVKGRILTGDYQHFNEPKALRELLEFPNLEVRVFTEEDFHTKGYFFEKDSVCTLIVGSSNLTQNALKANKEWNLKVNSLEQGELVQRTNGEFQAMWNRSQVLTEEWITETYEPLYREARNLRSRGKVERIRTYTLQPNLMQREAMKALANLRAQEKERALLISATGTGKTYLSAFDVRAFHPRRMLFLVHREMILKQALESFRDVLGEGISAGLLTGNAHDWDAQYLFSTVQTMSRESVLHQFAPDAFDYIVIDETHKAGAETYQRIMEYFKPKFLLGMTASPERTDGFDIFQLFDHNVAYEIRLQKAMEENLLCPFHYFGVTELTVDGQMIDDTTEFRHLISDQRVDHILKQADFYGYSGNRVKGLIFCSRKTEAEELSRLFNERGYQTIALSGTNSQEEREQAMERLEQEEREGGLDYIFTVDIFNEGVDIPQVNQVIMLRPTQSPIVFVQQLGRGLRKSPGKEYVVIIDFIGNYQKNFLIPIALSGDRTYNKDTIRRYVAEGNRVIPGCSTIHFDAVAKQRIFASIDQMKGLRKLMGESYANLKYRLGRIPSLVDFYENGEVDPLLILAEYKTYPAFLAKMERSYEMTQFTEQELYTLEYFSRIVARGKRPHESMLLQALLENETFRLEDMEEKLQTEYGLTKQRESLTGAIGVLTGSFVSGDAERQKYSEVDVLQEQNGLYHTYVRVSRFQEKLRRRAFRQQMEDLVTLGTLEYEAVGRTVQNRRGAFILYEKYSRRDVCLLLNWGKDLSSTMYGMKRLGKDVAIFITYHKGTAEEGLAYAEGKPDYTDTFLEGSSRLFLWESQIGKGPDSGYMKDVLEAEYKHLFIKKSDAEGTDFYYMGQVDILEVKAGQKKDNTGRMREISKVTVQLQDAVREELKAYLEA
ncbi:MAG: DEAD/DEAH box helicase [Lachnospiraceae bacterium]|nr:DEAD/DEAH box helicase [Lachnospiraceae bacterium]